MIIAPRNIGMSEPAITPEVAIAPITPPRCPLTANPPVNPMSSGISHLLMGPPTCASVSFGIHPVGINNAVRKPHAINAPIFGITIPDRKRPNFCMASCAPPPC